MKEVELESRLDMLGYVEGKKYSEEEYQFYNLAKEGDLASFESMIDEMNLVPSHEWEVNPVRGVIESKQERMSIIEVVLRHYGPERFVLQARCPHTDDTLLHLAAKMKKETLAIALIGSLALYNVGVHPTAAVAAAADDDNRTVTNSQHYPIALYNKDSFKRKRFLEAINHHGDTTLHIATNNLLTSLVAELCSEKRLKVNIKNQDGDTAFDIIKRKCEMCRLTHDWETPWRVSIQLRGAQAKCSQYLKKFEDEEDTFKKEISAIERLVMNETAWNLTTNAILVVSTLALSLAFGAVFGIPQILASGGGGGGTNLAKSTIHSLQASLRSSISFSLFLVCISVACLFMLFVITGVLFTITSDYIFRGLVLAFSWLCIGIMGLSLSLAYIVVVYIYMGSFFTFIALASAAIIALFYVICSFYFGLARAFWETLSNFLRMTILHGFIYTLLSNIPPLSFVRKLIPFDK